MRAVLVSESGTFLGAESGARAGVQHGGKVAVAVAVHSCVTAVWKTMENS